VRGIVNTPEAICESCSGKIWNQDLRIWAEKDCLAVLDEEDLGTQPPGRTARRRGDRGSGEGGPGGGNGEPDYYELLGVDQSATPEEIKQRYYILAKQWHPDKRPGDPAAKDHFQRLGEAYQVLSNPNLRERYDQDGAEGLDTNFIDASVFFGMLFGSERFEHLIGELAISTAARNSGNLSQKQMQRIQAQREQTLAINLKALLRRYVEGDEAGFKESMVAEAKELASASFGELILHTVGRVYSMQAKIHLGNLWTSAVSGMAQRFNMLQHQLYAANAALQVYRAHAEMESLAASDAAQQPDGSNSSTDAQHQRRQLEENALPLMLDAMWAANVVDIENTLRAVCKETLKDSSATGAVKRARMRALEELGKIFLETEATPGREKTAKEFIEAAMQHTFHRQNGMVPSEEDG